MVSNGEDGTRNPRHSSSTLHGSSSPPLSWSTFLSSLYYIFLLKISSLFNLFSLYSAFLCALAFFCFLCKSPSVVRGSFSYPTIPPTLASKGFSGCHNTVVSMCCRYIETRGGVYDEISPEPKGFPEGSGNISF